MTYMKLWMVGAVSLAAVGCDPGPLDSNGTDGNGGPEPGCIASNPLSADAEELAINGRADAAVGIALLGELGDTSENVLLSPLSLRIAFGQVYAGTSGASRDEIGAVLELDVLGERIHEVLGATTQRLHSRNAEETEESGALIFRPANRSFFDTSYETKVNEDWKAKVGATYGFCVEFFAINADIPAAIEHINTWVADQTHDKVPDLIKFLPDPTALVVVNALYFRASWATPFDEPSMASFTTHAGEQIDVPTLFNPALPVSYAESSDWQAVGIPYSDAALEMVVILPGATAAAGFEEGLDAETLDGIFDALEPDVVALALPAFDITSKYELVQSLMQLGMSAPFSSGADFEGIAQGLPPIVAVFHDVSIAIDEKGTEAAAATGIVFGDGGLESDPTHSVVVDRTFYVAIRDREVRSVLFFARIGDPSAKQ